MDKYGNRNGNDETNLPPPPPYSPTLSSSSRQESNNPPYNVSRTTGDANSNEPEPTAPSLYPEIPSNTSYTYRPLSNNNNNNNNNSNNNEPSPIVRTIFPMPTPQPHYHNNNNNNNMPYPYSSPHIPPPPSPHSPIQNNPNNSFYETNQGNYQSIPIPPRIPQQQPFLFFQHPYHHHHHHQYQQQQQQSYDEIEEIRRNRRRFPFGAILFVFGWFFPPLWILGACCCSASRNSYERFWAKLNLIMALLLLLSSVLYSMLALVAGDWYVGLQWAFATKQEI